MSLQFKFKLAKFHPFCEHPFFTRTLNSFRNCNAFWRFLEGISALTCGSNTKETTEIHEILIRIHNFGITNYKITKITPSRLLQNASHTWLKAKGFH